jgi:hypothetical protein
VALKNDPGGALTSIVRMKPSFCGACGSVTLFSAAIE